MLQFPGVSVSVQQSQAVRDTSGTNFSFLQIVCQNTEYWCWWNSVSLWYFRARRSTIFCKKVRHRLHISFICWCFRPSWLWIIVYGDTSFTKTSCPTGNCTTVHCLLTTNFTQSTVNFCRVLSRKVSIFIYDLWSSTVTVREAPVDAKSNTRQFKTAYTREVTNTRVASSSLQL
jgi:hypothetical protein